MMPFVPFTPLWRLSPELRRFQGQLPWLVGWAFAPGRLLSVKVETALPLGRWMRWEKRPIWPRVYRPLPLTNTVLISESTRRLVSAAFDLQDLGLQELKGVTEPLHVYRVLAAKNIASRFEAAHAGHSYSARWTLKRTKLAAR